MVEGFGIARVYLIAVAVGIAVLVGAGQARGFWHQVFSVSDGVPAQPYARVVVSDPPLPQPLLDSLASTIAVRPITVNCNLPLSGTRLGDFRIGSSVINLLPEICVDLNHFLHLNESEWRCILADAQANCPGSVDQTVIAMHVFAHEASHALGIVNEVATDCNGYRDVPYVAWRLAANPARAQALIRYYHDHYQTIRGVVPGYMLAPC